LSGNHASGYADVAQLVEHFLGKEEVSGSSPVISSEKLKRYYYGKIEKCKTNNYFRKLCWYRVSLFYY
jgi:hypothetical protein